VAARGARAADCVPVVEFLKGAHACLDLTPAAWDALGISKNDPERGEAMEWSASTKQ
jgi:hypothetical protein